MNTKLLINRIRSGYHKTIQTYPRMILLLGYILLMVITTVKLSDSTRFAQPTQFILLFAIVYLLLCYIIGVPFEASRYNMQLIRVGIVDSNGSPPLLLHRTQNSNGSLTLQFDSSGIPLNVWEDRKNKVETALNITISSIKHGADYHTIIIDAMPGNSVLPDILPWNDDMTPKDSSTLLLGQSLTGSVEIDLSKIPMWLIGGATGSGKSVLTKLIARQCIYKDNVRVAIVDFKGGLDYDPLYKDSDNSIFISTLEDLAQSTNRLTETLEIRKQILSENNNANIDDFNAANPYNKLSRIVIIIDEVAEVLDKTGLPKDKKQFIQEKVEAPLATIARMGRAFGIHLILSLQRPDAEILNGQIRSNISGRIAGRCDNNLSLLILDSTEAADRIDVQEQGTFIINDIQHTKFKAYYTD